MAKKKIDPLNKKAYGAVSAALAASGATALLVTHDQSEALGMGLEVAVLRGGVFAQIATPEILYRNPVDIAMARFVGEAVLLPGTVKEAAATCALGRLPIALSAPDLVAVKRMHGLGIERHRRMKTIFSGDLLLLSVRFETS